MPAPAYSTIPYLLQVGARADQPLATDVGIGTLYSVSDEGFLIEQSDGATWGQWGPAGSGSSLPATVQGDTLYASAADTISALAKTSDRRSLVNTGATNNPAWDGAQILIATVNLTNAEIIALPTTPKTLVAAPGSGLRIKPIAASLSVNNGGGLYTNVNATYASIQLQYAGGNWASLGMWNDSVHGIDMITTLLATAAAGRRYYDFQTEYLEAKDDATPADTTDLYVNGLVEATASAENLDLQLTMDNNGSGVLTGGDAANVGRVTLYYAIEALAP